MRDASGGYHSWLTPSSAKSYVTLQEPEALTDPAMPPNVRECKTIHLAGACTHLRLVCAPPHVHPLNLYNQVCLLDVQVMGYPISGAAAAGAWQTPGDAGRTFGRDPVLAGIMDALPPTLRSWHPGDRVIGEVVDAFQSLKILYIQREAYRGANVCKEQLGRLAPLQEEAGRLEAQKQEALRSEDFVVAEVLKVCVCAHACVVLYIHLQMCRLHMHRTKLLS
jgi:hypothetical protein